MVWHDERMLTFAGITLGLIEDGLRWLVLLFRSTGGCSRREPIPAPAAGVVHRARCEAGGCCDLRQLCRAGEAVRMARRLDGRGAGDFASLASCRLAVVLAPEVPTGSTADSRGTARADSQNGEGEPPVGRGADCQRTVAQIRHPNLAANGEQVPSKATSRTAARRPALVNLLEESSDGDSRARFLHRRHRYLPDAVRARRRRACLSPPCTRERYRAPKRRLDVATIERGDRRQRRGQVPDPRPGPDLRNA